MIKTEFLFALFGGLFVAYKIGSSQAKDKERTSQIRSWSENNAEMRKKYVDRNTERIIIHNINSGENSEKIINELKDELVYVFGDDYKEKFCLPDGYCVSCNDYYFNDLNDPNSAPYWAIRLLLAKRGLIHSFDYECGVGIRAYKFRHNPLYQKMLRCLEKNYSDAGHPELKFIFVGDGCNYLRYMHQSVGKYTRPDDWEILGE